MCAYLRSRRNRADSFPGGSVPTLYLEQSPGAGDAAIRNEA